MQAALQEPQGNNVKPPMATAWNWLENVQVAYAIFNQKLGFIRQIETKKNTSEHSGLIPLTQVQVEEMALLQYGGFAGPLNPAAQYFVVQFVGGKWQWVPNTKVSSYGVRYVTNVENAVPPPQTTCP